MIVVINFKAVERNDCDHFGRDGGKSVSLRKNLVRAENRNAKFSDTKRGLVALKISTVPFI
jgi:hypothetical protein